MKIKILIKIVPATQCIQIDRVTGNLLRETTDSKLNPSDEKALEIARNYTYHNPDTSIECISMSARYLEKLHRQILALGADKVTVLTDDAFIGSDAWATSNVLYTYLKHENEWDLLLVGEQSIDGSTGQIPIRLSERLQIPLVFDVIGINRVDNQTIVVSSDKKGEKRFLLKGRAILVVSSETIIPYYPSLTDLSDAGISGSVNYLDKIDLGLSNQDIGHENSKTKVINTYIKECKKQCMLLKNIDDYQKLLSKLKG
ncbi:MAG: hypothetical protein Q4G61_04345 [Tissierellia bacterium]|nr:hypothetical protein [Tissierellia bacterium]